MVEAAFLAINCVDSQLWKTVYISSIFMPSCTAHKNSCGTRMRK